MSARTIQQVGKKSNEPKAIPKLLKYLDLAECITTMNASACQRDIVKAVVKAKADYMICVKENQKKLHDTIRSWFDELDMEGNKGNGQTAKILGWGNAHSAVCLSRVRTCLKTGQTATEKRYYITSLPLASKRIMHVVRTHWSIENNLHWQLDVTFNEDSQRKKRNAARNFSLLCKIALTQLKNNPRTGSLAMKRKMAGWNVDFLKELLDAEAL